MHQSRANGCFPFIQVLMVLTLVQFCVVVWNFIFYPSYYMLYYSSPKHWSKRGFDHWVESLLNIWGACVIHIIIQEPCTFFCIREAFVQCIRAHHFFMIQASKISWKSIQSSMCLNLMICRNSLTIMRHWWMNQMRLMPLRPAV